MINYLERCKTWYETRKLRERLLVLILCWAFIYALFSIIFFLPLDREESVLRSVIKEDENQINNWKTQIAMLDKLAQTPLYKKWLEHRKSFKNLEGEYRYLLQTSATKQWQDVIKTLLRAQNNIKLVQIKNSPEALYNQTTVNNANFKIYEQEVMLVIYSNYFDTLNYLAQLEKILPNIHWDKIHYQVAQYPLAKIEMEFSILYEKSH